jgi:hypothetical protein
MGKNWREKMRLSQAEAAASGWQLSNYLRTRATIGHPVLI